jgi:hypothetical protein
MVYMIKVEAQLLEQNSKNNKCHNHNDKKILKNNDVHD